MLFLIASLVGMTVAYVSGSVPTAYLIGRVFYGLDIRERGSKSVGATNALRVLGRWPALAVLLVDILKGAAAIILVRALWVWLFAHVFVAPPAGIDQQTWTAWATAFAGLAALLGHSRSIWLSFSGGKSVATGLGVVLAISWPIALSSLLAFAIFVAVSRIVSLGSVVAAVTAIVLVCGLDQPLPYRLLIVAGGLYVLARHRSNLGRIRAGTEPRVGQSLKR
jgi:acyl phosphate:glycerol-3-phosphate acyltransferase